MRQDIKSIIAFCIGGNPDGFRVTCTSTGKVYEGSDLVPPGRYTYEWKMDWVGDAPEWAEGDFEISITPLGEIVDHTDELIAKIELAMINQMKREIKHQLQEEQEEEKNVISFQEWVKTQKKG
tara:strand:- start:845 stop:1213 length:369 start_codon:yes stop_codon:yes gene_type:complete